MDALLDQIQALVKSGEDPRIIVRDVQQVLRLEQEKAGRPLVDNRRTLQEWGPVFLEALAETGSVTRAAELAGINRSLAYEARGRSSRFDRLWEEALQRGTDGLVDEAIKRATTGRSDQLLMFLIKLRSGQQEKAATVVVNNTQQNVAVPIRAMDYRESVRALAPPTIDAEEQDYRSLPDKAEDG